MTLIDKKKIDIIKEYEKNATQAANETQKKEFLLNLLPRIFPEEENRIKEIINGSEETIREIKQKDRSKTGRADTYTGKLLIEFENSLKKSGEHAKQQLIEYLSGIQSKKKNVFDFKPITSDGIIWRVYSFNKEIILNEKIWENKNLLVINEEFELNQNYEEFYFFLNKYLIIENNKEPSLSKFLDEFGFKSEIYNESIFELKKVFDELKDDSSVKVAFQEWKRYLSIAYNKQLNDERGFLTHTYLSLLAKILAYQILSNDDYIDEEELEKILTGQIFYEHNVNNFTEKDFFAWCSTRRNIKKIFHICSKIKNKFNEYNFQNVNEDILKGIYQELIDEDTKKSLGEYYTPDWLCTEIVNKKITNTKQRVLDPACGSGSFLRAFVEKFYELDNKISPDVLSSQIYGFDIHPLSVLISKTTLLLAIKSNYKKEFKKSIYLNIFLTNTVLPPLKKNIFGEEIEININDDRVVINAGIFQHQELFNTCLEFCELLADIDKEKNNDSQVDFKEKLLARCKNKKIDFNINQYDVDSFYKIYKSFLKAKKQNKDTIWKFIIGNLIKPFFFKKTFDLIIGNPPWFTLGKIKNENYQKELKEIGGNYNFLPQSRNIVHLEIAAIFIIHCFESYLKENSDLIFVLPRSFFNGQHHEKTRRENYPNFNISEIWDLGNVSPLFKIPSCVIFFNNFSKKFAETKSKLLSENEKNNIISDKKWLGKELHAKFNSPDLSLKNAKNEIKTINKTYYLDKLGAHTAIVDVKPTIIKSEVNYYKSKFKQGASIAPRNFYFVDNKNSIENDEIVLETDKIQSKSAKEPYKSLFIKGKVSKKYLFYTALGNSLLPFVNFNHKLVVLPLDVSSTSNKLLSTEDLVNLGEIETSEWFSQAEKYWKKFSNKNKRTENLASRLNFQSLLTSQDFDKKFIVLYAGGGKNSFASVHKRGQLNRPFVADTKTYCFFTNNIDEAYYLTAFLNSNFANNKIRQFKTRGTFGERDSHTRILDVNCSEFSKKNQIMIDIVSLSKRCEKIVKEYLTKSDIDNNLGQTQLGNLRKKISELLKKEISEIDKFFNKL